MIGRSESVGEPGKGSDQSLAERQDRKVTLSLATGLTDPVTEEENMFRFSLHFRDVFVHMRESIHGSTISERVIWPIGLEARCAEDGELRQILVLPGGGE